MTNMWLPRTKIASELPEIPEIFPFLQEPRRTKLFHVLRAEMYIARRTQERIFMMEAEGGSWAGYIEHNLKAWNNILKS
jgi:hypothetical protein